MQNADGVLIGYLDGAVSFREPLGQTKVMQIHQGETLNHQGAIANEVCCLAAQYVAQQNSPFNAGLAGLLLLQARFSSGNR